MIKKRFHKKCLSCKGTGWARITKTDKKATIVCPPLFSLVTLIEILPYKQKREARTGDQLEQHLNRDALSEWAADDIRRRGGDAGKAEIKNHRNKEEGSQNQPGTCYRVSEIVTETQS